MQKKKIVISIANQKGGVGKTTTVVNIAASLADLGYLVLVIDCDYQANATSLLCGDEQLNNPHKNFTYAIKNDLTVKDVAISSKIINVDIVPANRDLDDLREQLMGQPNQFKLVEFLINCNSAKKYDFILLDTHPSLDCFFQSAIAVSDHYIIPLFPEADSSRGLAHQLTIIEKTKKYLNPNLNFLGCLIVKYDQYNATHQKFEKLIRQFALSRKLGIFKTNIPNSQSVAAASAHGLALCHYKKTSLASKAYKNLSKEILEIIKGKEEKTRYEKKNLVLNNDFDVAIDL